MTSPDYTRGYLRMPHAVWRAVFCRAPVTRRQLQLVSVVIRESWGWQKRGGEVYLWTRPLAPRDFAAATGLSTDHLSRDLSRLVAGGVLQEQEGRYQFVPDPALWKTFERRTTKARPAASSSPAGNAEASPIEPFVKTGKKSERHAGPPPEEGLSPGGENAASTGPLSSPQASSAPVLSRAETRFCEVVAAFVGDLTPELSASLRRWIAADGVSTVWAVLGPVLPRGPKAVRQWLEARVLPRPAPPRPVRRIHTRRGPDAGTVSR
jgi:hypothetical protein